MERICGDHMDRRGMYAVSGGSSFAIQYVGSRREAIVTSFVLRSL